jgi:hypothetical protein
VSVTASVEGVDRLVGTLEAAAGDLVDLDLSPVAVDLAAAAVPRTRVDRGWLRDTVRASVVDDAVVLEAGGGPVDYAGIVHAYDPWLAETITAEETRVVDQVTDQVVDIIESVQGI